jgi:hypothetical protein
MFGIRIQRDWPVCVAGAMLLAIAACDDESYNTTPMGVEVAPSMSMEAAAPPAPGGLVDVGDLSLWPWTGRDLDATIADPMNLVFVGDVDIVRLRAALLSLDGNRTAFGFPDSYPFNCTWSDAHGEVQTTYTDAAGWVGSAVQLQCGNYDPMRFHVRLFDAGDVVVAAVHLDLLIPGTPQHQVLAWDLPQDLVLADFVRGGFLGGAPGFVQVNAPGSVQAIPKPIYDAPQLEPLKVPLGLPAGPAVGPAVPIPNDGLAAVITVAGLPEPSADLDEYSLELPFAQLIPRPFCSQGPADYVYVSGPVHIEVSTRVNAMGRLESHNTLRGDLTITPFDVSTMQPSGEPFPAKISEIDNATVGPNGTSVNAVLMRKGVPPSNGFLSTHLVTGPNGSARFTYSEKCD